MAEPVQTPRDLSTEPGEAVKEALALFPPGPTLQERPSLLLRLALLVGQRFELQGERRGCLRATHLLRHGGNRPHATVDLQESPLDHLQVGRGRVLSPVQRGLLGDHVGVLENQACELLGGRIQVGGADVGSGNAVLPGRAAATHQRRRLLR